jgi:membrane fusion protein, heavy metal efflux system
MSRIAWFLSACLLAACGHDHGDSAAKPSELPALSITHFSERTELFVEFEPLRQGEESAFAAHVTRLDDFKPISEGTLTVVLSGGGQPDERFEVAAPAAPGIFKPVARPRVPGMRMLTVSVNAPGLQDRHELGQVTVFQNTPAALQAMKKSTEDSLIKFLKEQQWQVDFATAPVAPRPMRETVSATGIIRGTASGSAQLVAPVSGQIAAAGRNFPHVGTTLARGDVLFSIIPRLAGDVDVATLRLALDKARLHLEHEQKERARLEVLFKEEAIPERRILAARHEEELARAEFETARRRLAPYQGGSQSANGVIVRAPVTGTVVELGAAPGAFVNEGQALAQVADPSTLWLETRVAEADAGRIRDVDGAWIYAPGAKEPLALEIGRNSRLVSFGQALDSVTRTVPLILEFQNSKTALPIGTAVRVEIWIGSGGERMAVPASALVEEGGQQVVFVQRGGESFERRVVATGIRDGTQVEVREGLKAGERVVTRGAYLVRLAGASPKAAGEGHVH